MFKYMSQALDFSGSIKSPISEQLREQYLLIMNRLELGEYADPEHAKQDFILQYNVLFAAPNNLPTI